MCKLEVKSIPELQKSVFKIFLQDIIFNRFQDKLEHANVQIAKENNTSPRDGIPYLMYLPQ